ncbi:TIGR00725 family protein [Desulfuromonas acetoxidans]|uniref:TIGR00725 family protein n=1 Tax=Desulfuromonas acetoxidans TaxID=891 RepID=UPI002931D733|nr:TIGR00725 family protein [Desulfuromonas acetoxidans]
MTFSPQQTTFPLVAVIGGGTVTAEQYQLARQVGYTLAQAGVDVVCGGLGGVMEAVSRGCREGGGHVIGLLPGNDADDANPWVSYPLPTGLGHARNMLVAQSAPVVIAIAGEYGTLSELAIALKTGRVVVTLGGWQDIPGVCCAHDADQAAALALETLIAQGYLQSASGSAGDEGN